MQKTKESWIERIKMFACVLVVAGHFFQSMIMAGILPRTALYDWFVDTIYFFHVPLFFICSGYLYQKRSCVNSVGSWKTNILKKAVALGIPYVVFSAVTWALKSVFSDSVNTQNEALVETLLLSPASPYWYLYALFFIFLVTPTFRDKKMAGWVLAGSSAAKAISVFTDGTEIFALDTVLTNEIWFVLGMVMCVFDLPTVLRRTSRVWVGYPLAALFAVLSVAVSVAGWDAPVIGFGMGILGCTATILIVLQRKADREILPLVTLFAKNTMPVFLMHTIFAAGLRAVLMKLGIMAPAVHMILGLSVSFAGPVIAAEIMQRLKLDVILNPAKYIKISPKS